MRLFKHPLLRDERVLIALALLLGFIGRSLWALHYHNGMGEAQNAAIGLATNGYISDVYRPKGTVFWPDGLPSAHLLPIPIGIAAAVYKVTGIETAASTVLLTLIAIATTFTGYLLLYRLFKTLGLTKFFRLGAMLTLCLVLLNAHLETEDFRFWEGGYAVAGMAAFLLMLYQMDGQLRISWMSIAAVALLNALLFFISPQFGIGGYVCLALFSFRRLTKARWATMAVACIAALALFIGPWALRNQRVMGHPILLRSNLGLELALAFNDNALNPDQGEGFKDQLFSIHPNADDNSYARMRLAGGEVAYANLLGAQTYEWVKQHPFSTAKLAVQHLISYVFPQPWMLTIYYARGPNFFDYIRIAIFWLVSLFGLAGLFICLVQDWRKFQYIAAMIIVSSSPYAIVQPILRYHYNLFGLLIFFSFFLFESIYSKIRSSPLSYRP
ncbi:hypothetical protein P7D22_06005 [Lichenihabitans sp. Uapishka_5]|uniref:hypothetical protein n=1 Tax=Lichenihabitans sp. Uapishka_5 TaxID=3037302 RepID=UPI0029E7E06B|nr:hypothetical protein [Lichenihabitans sp. Uapishka_5]MDX7950732.1 hypothetical protein [Lichenihabitans sp. Uapishka_5]